MPERYEISFASTKAAVAASPPTRAVWNALRIGIAPVKRPLMYPNTVRAIKVTITEKESAVCARAETIYGASGVMPPPMYAPAMVRALVSARLGSGLSKPSSNRIMGGHPIFCCQQHSKKNLVSGG